MPPTNVVHVTKWPSLTDTHTHRAETLDWPGLVRTFADPRAYISLHAKSTAPGFGPYRVSAPLVPCGHGVLTAHRCDRCVDALTMAVFDADAGDRTTCAAALAAEGVAHLWYSSWSYDPVTKPHAFRLVVPLALPVPADQWPQVRAAMLARWGVPADATKCGGRSHFYYLPSCPPGTTPVVHAVAGEWFDWRRLPLVTRPAPSTRVVRGVATWAPPAEPDEPVALEPLRAALLARAEQFARVPRLRRKADGLRRVVHGLVLAERGSRNDTTNAIAGMVAHVLPDATLGTLWRLMEPSVVAMQDAGSRLTRYQVEGMLQRALEFEHDRRQDPVEARADALRAAWDARERKQAAEREVTAAQIRAAWAVRKQPQTMDHE